VIYVGVKVSRMEGKEELSVDGTGGRKELQ